MILSRCGNKKRIADKIIRHFPRHKIYIEPFFGASGIFFNKPLVKHNFLNDNDDNVYNLFRVILEEKEEFEKLFKLFPITETQFNEWRDGKKEKTNVMNAIRFITLSNFSYLGRMDLYSSTINNRKINILNRVQSTFNYLETATVFNKDWLKFISSIAYDPSNIRREKQNSFIYCDPPYLNTNTTYKSNFKEKDSKRLFEFLNNFGVSFAISEFEHPFILEQVKKYNLNIVEIGERRNLKNVRTEILITNYDTEPNQLF